MGGGKDRKKQTKAGYDYYSGQERVNVLIYDNGLLITMKLSKKDKYYSKYNN
ncbi:MAG: hypothetical protein ACLRVE_05105 [Finegoldia magna]|uniref:hypothetical protein n=1 Tax=Finegoldia magna TaxID=1260 RepID=UPI0039A09E4E